MQSLPEIGLGGKKKKNSQSSFLPACMATPKTLRSAAQCISACLHHIRALFLQPAVWMGLLYELARSSEETLITSMGRDTQSCWWTLPRVIEYFSSAKCVYITGTTDSTVKKSRKSQVSVNITQLHWFQQGNLVNTNGESGLTCGNHPLPASPKAKPFQSVDEVALQGGLMEHTYRPTGAQQRSLSNTGISEWWVQPIKSR